MLDFAKRFKGIKNFMPYIDDGEKLKNCNDCAKPCIEVCPNNIIVQNDFGVSIDFNNGYCIFCEKCKDECATNGKNILDSNISKINNISFYINELSCIAWKKSICDVCKDLRCDAIVFSGFFYPYITEDCTNCGKCMQKCCVNAIEYKII